MDAAPEPAALRGRLMVTIILAALVGVATASVINAVAPLANALVTVVVPAAVAGLVSGLILRPRAWWAIGVAALVCAGVVTVLAWWVSGVTWQPAWLLAGLWYAVTQAVVTASVSLVPWPGGGATGAVRSSRARPARTPRE